MNPLTQKTKSIETPCLWMQAGVVKKKTCTHYYECAGCRFDSAMAKAVNIGKHISWQEAMRRLDSRERTCRHTLTGRAGHKVCPMNYNCQRCDFDQTFEDTLVPGRAQAVTQVQDIKGFKLPMDHFFHTGHTWARIEAGSILRVGMDDFSLRVLGSPDALTLPLMGEELRSGCPGWGMKRQDNTADVLSPINGVITKVNPDPMKDPVRMADDPYSAHWLFTVHNSDLKGAVSPLMDETESPAWLGREVSGLEKMVEAVSGPLSADGGIFVQDVYGSLPGLGWNRLVNRFLGT
ncbi:MAG: glycine cleavage system protein H [Desulfobacter sp.]|nr:MAG: glycine cleavage system protein H [Desulfobacter sp.]